MRIIGLMKTTLLDYPGKVASTLFTGGCNFRCPYCHNMELVLSGASMEEYTHSEIFDHLRKRRGALGGVCITGGEPTLNSDLPDFIGEIKDLGLCVKLDTNGTNPDMLSSLLRDNLLDYVAMDIKHSRARYNEVACMKNFDITAIDQSIKLLRRSDIDYEFRTTVTREYHDLATLNEIAEWISPCKAYYLQPYKESDAVLDKSLTTYSSSEFNEIVESLRKYDIVNVDARAIG